MKKAIEETDRRREKQVAYNTEHNIQPLTIYKAVRDLTDRVKVAEGKDGYDGGRTTQDGDASLGARLASLPKAEQKRLVEELEAQMRQAAKDLEFEKAAMLRDQILELRQLISDVDDKTPEWEKIRKIRDYGVDGELERVPAGGEVEAAPTTYAVKKPTKVTKGSRRRR
jgi:excinuclease ABC subunit B